jgi:hypothetical protein
MPLESRAMAPLRQLLQGLPSFGRGGSTIAGIPAEVDYDWHVRPILSENRFERGTLIEEVS